MKVSKSHFRYSNSDRNGILFLAIIIVALQFIYFFVDFSKENLTEEQSTELLQFQQEIDSLKKVVQEDSKPKIFPFNPSFLTDYRGYQLGMSTEEIDKLLQHRAAGKFINSSEEFQQVTGVSDSLLKTIEPYFKFPDWVVNNQKKTNSNQNLKTVTNSTPIEIRDLNAASAKDLTVINGIGEKLANRIISYRNRLGGYSLNNQLYEVYYLDKEVADRVLKQFQVLSKPTIAKININTATFKEVLSIVYIDYDLTKKIFEYRDEVAEIQSLDELKKIEGFPIEKFNRIALYLEAK
jgi:DNA uptake protein ComE-like DNA-binding protein